MDTKDEYGIWSQTPLNLGWLQRKLNPTEINHLWDCVKNKGEDNRYRLAGNISASHIIPDKNNWLFEHTLLPLCSAYGEIFENLGDRIPTSERHTYNLQGFWVNYQYQTEFNPLHSHSGIYSFTIWLKIPTEYVEQKKKPIAAASEPKDEEGIKPISNFAFFYVDILGNIRRHIYEMTSRAEGHILFFPSQLQHEVYPFYDCDEERISISGNIGLDTKDTN